VRVYSPGLFTWARSMGLQEVDAADLVQDVLLKLLKELPDFQYDQGKSFRRWLWTLSKNVYLKRLRRRVPELADPEVLDEQETAPEEPFWEEEFRQHMFNRVLTIVEKEFPSNTWRAFWGHVVDGKPASQVSAELGINLWAVYTAKFRVLAYLHEELADFAPTCNVQHG
jgi:RNA polymerase sigma-70 factor, ECF subfamily